jgi:hypothetical protein
VGEAITRCEDRDEGWYIAELLRIIYELYRQMAEEQGIVGWSSGSVPALEMDQSLPDYEI